MCDRHIKFSLHHPSRFPTLVLTVGMVNFGTRILDRPLILILHGKLADPLADSSFEANDTSEPPKKKARTTVEVHDDEPTPDPTDPKFIEKALSSASKNSVTAKTSANSRINRRIVFEGHAYLHLCTVFTLPGHFFTMVTYKDQTWTYDGILGEQGGDRLLWQSADEYVCGAASNFGRNAMAYVHAYGLEAEAEEVEDVKMDDVEGETFPEPMDDVETGTGSKPLDDPDSGDDGNQDESDEKGDGEHNSDPIVGVGQSDVKDKSSGRGSRRSRVRRSKRKSGESERKSCYNLRAKR